MIKKKTTKTPVKKTVKTPVKKESGHFKLNVDVTFNEDGSQKVHLVKTDICCNDTQLASVMSALNKSIFSKANEWARMAFKLLQFING